MADWREWEKRLKGAGEDIDDAVDDLVSQVISAPPDPAAAPALILALDSARSDLSRADTATALAWAAGDEDVLAVDCLERAFERDKANPFLAPSLLGALGLL